MIVITKIAAVRRIVARRREGEVAGRVDHPGPFDLFNSLQDVGMAPDDCIRSR